MRIKIWVILIALLTAVTGEAKVSSPFVLVSENPSCRQVLTQCDTAVKEEFCTTEMLGIHSNVEECRLTVGYTLMAMAVLIILQGAVYYSGGFETVSVRSHFRKEQVTIYMHKSDGKKRI